MVEDNSSAMEPVSKSAAKRMLLNVDELDSLDVMVLWMLLDADQKEALLKIWSQASL